MPMGCAGIQLRNNRVSEYPPMRLSTSNKGWHLYWFYIKNNIAAPLLEFIGRLIEEVPESWRKWGFQRKTRRKSRTISPLFEF